MPLAGHSPARPALHRSWMARCLQLAVGMAAALAVVQLTGCATPQLEAQWRNPQVPARSLQGQRLLVACEAPELTLQRLCEERMAAEVVAQGGTPVLVQELVVTPGSDAYVSAARSTGSAASARLVQVPGGQLMWTARASAAPSNDPAAQLAELARTTLDGAQKAGWF